MLSFEYIIALFLVCLAALKFKHKLFAYIAFSYLCFLAIFRGITVGTDTLGYYEDFRQLTDFKTNIFHNFNVGIRALILMLKSSLDSFDCYLFFVSLLAIPLILGVLQYSKQHQIPLGTTLFPFFTLGYYFFNFNIMRQMMIIGVILCFCKLLDEKKYVLFASVCCITGYFLHTSAFIMCFLIPLHLFSNRIANSSKKMQISLVLFTFCLFFFGKEFLQDALSPIAAIFDYEGYIRGLGEEDLGYTFNSIQSLFSIFIIYNFKPGRDNFEYSSFFAGILLYNIFSMFSSQSSRIAECFLIFIVFLLSSILVNNDVKNKKMVKPVIILYCFAIFYYRFIMNNFGAVSPYIFNFTRF